MIQKPLFYQTTSAMLMLGTLALPFSSAHAGAPTTDGFGNWQQIDIQAQPPIANAGIAYDFQATYLNAWGLPPRPPSKQIIRWPRGARWNGAQFPQCDPTQLQAVGPAACPPNSLFLRGEAVAAVGLQALKIRATIQGFVGTPRNGHETQVFYIEPDLGPSFVLTGVFVDETSGPYGASEYFDFTEIPGATALLPSPIVVLSFHSEDLHTHIQTYVNGQEVMVPLTVAPPSCESGFWYYALESYYRVGKPLKSTGRQPCTPGSGGQ